MKATPKGWPRLSSAVFYDDAAAAIDWLCQAFGFDVRLRVEGDHGRIEHSELVYGEGLIMVGQAGRESASSGDQTFPTSPKSVGGANTQTLMLFVDDVDAHCVRARAAGAMIFSEPGSSRLRRRLLGRPQLWRRGSRGTSLVVYAATGIPNVMPNARSTTRFSRLRIRPGAALSTCCGRSHGAPAILPRRFRSVRRSLSRHLRVLRKSGLSRTARSAMTPASVCTACGRSASQVFATGLKRSKRSGRPSCPRSRRTPSEPETAHER